MKAPVAAVFTWFLMMLLLMLMVAKGTALLMAVKAPVPAWVPAITLFPEMVRVPVPAVNVAMPVYMAATVPAAVHPEMVLPVMVTLLPAALEIPVNELMKAALPVTRPEMTLSVIEIASVAPELIAVMAATAAAAVVMLLMVFDAMVLAPNVIDITVMAADPPVQFWKVLLLKVLFRLVFEFDHPVIVVIPVTVTFEKLL